MQIVEEDLAPVDQAKAYQIGDVLLVQVTGTKRTACHIVSIERGLLDVEPPAFIARLSVDIRARCGPDPVPFEAQQAFRVGIYREQVVVHHSGGRLDVAVEELSAQIASTRGSVFDVGGEPGEAVGYSQAYDLGEAIRDAIDKLPPQGVGIPDWLSTYSVLSVGAEIGGLAGFNHLKVHVTG